MLSTNKERNGRLGSMSDSRKRKIRAVLQRSTQLPGSLQFIPSKEPPTNGPHVKRQKVVETAQETVTNTWDSSLLALQAEQLLKRTRIGDIDADLVKLVDSVRHKIEKLPESRAMKMHDIEKLLEQSNIVAPFLTDPPADLQLTFRFVPPSFIGASGIYSIDAQTRNKSSAMAELLVEMPEHLIQPKDYLNHRIHFKATLYLCQIAASMKSKYQLFWRRDSAFGVEQIALLISYKSSELLLRVSVPRDSLDFSKLAPTKNADRSVDGPTPSYNASTMILAQMRDLTDRLQKANTASPRLRDSILLASRLIERQQLPISVEQFSIVTAALLTGGGKNGGKVLSPNASPLQLLRGTLQFLISGFAETASMAFGRETNEPGFWIDSFNLFSNMTEQDRSYFVQRTRALMTLLNDVHLDPIHSFAKVFLENHTYPGTYDLMIDISTPIVDIQRIWRTLERAIGTRTQLIRLFPVTTENQSPLSAIPSAALSTVKICISLRHETSQSAMILGPASESPDAKSFRGFWSTYAELRKFKDGRILETVLLDSVNPTFDAIRKILSLHFPSLPNVAEWKVHGLQSAKAMALSKQQDRVATEFDEFARLARELEDLPLRISTITSTAAIFAKSAAALPDSLDAVLTFERSARWPDDVEAIQRTKIAFLIALTSAFVKLPVVTSAQVGLENQEYPCEIQTIVNIGFMKIITNTERSYILRIHAERESTLLKTFIASPELSNQPYLRTRYRSVLALYHETFIDAEVHSQEMRNLSSLHPAWAGTASLLKQWFNAQNLSSYVTESVVDLLALKPFLCDPEEVTASAYSGFCKVIRFLSAWDWRLESLNLTGEHTTHATNDKAFEEIKKSNAGHSLCIFPPYSHTNGHLTIARHAALRMTALAKSTFADLSQTGDISIAMADGSLADFDIVLYLAAPSTHQKKYKNIKSQADDSYAVRQLLLKDLEGVYKDVLWFYYSSSSIDRVGIKFDPSLSSPRKFKANLGFGSAKVSSEEDDEDSDKVVVNRQGIIAEIRRIGGSLITQMVYP